MKIVNTWKSLMLLVVTTVFGLTMLGSAHAAPATPVKVEKKPYEYDFVVPTNDDEVGTYNGFTGVKDLVITFDKDIKNNPDTSKISVVQGGMLNPNLKIIKSKLINGNKLTIKFENLEFIDTTRGIEFQLVIPKETVHTDQLEKYVFPFKLYDVTPGFKSVFANPTNAGLINTNIFKNNAPRDVELYLPKMYLTKIETIHRVEKAFDDEILDPNKKPFENPAMTNIDVLADDEAARLKVNFNSQALGKAQHDRDLNRREDISGFSMGQAGIEALECETAEGTGDEKCKSANDFTLSAYDKNGRKLTERSFKVKVNKPKMGTPSKNDIIMNDYIPKADAAFGQIRTLYQFLADQKLSSTVLQQLPVDEYDRIGIVYKVNSTVDIENPEQLKMALINPNINKINLDGGTFVGDFTAMRNVAIENGKIKGNLVLGDGTKDLDFRLSGMTLEGDLTINAGENGTVILESSEVRDIQNSNPGNTYIVSAGANSVHLYDFKSKIIMRNEKEVRIVGYNFPESKMELELEKSGGLLLEGDIQELSVTSTDDKIGTLTIRNMSRNIKVLGKNTKNWTIKQGNKVEVVEHGDWQEVIFITDGPTNKEVKEVTANEIQGSITSIQETGITFTDDKPDFEMFPADLVYQITDPYIFGASTNTSIKTTSNVNYLVIKNLQAPEERIEKEVIMEAEKNNIIYRVKINVVID